MACCLTRDLIGMGSPIRAGSKSERVVNGKGLENRCVIRSGTRSVVLTIIGEVCRRRLRVNGHGLVGFPARSGAR